MQTSTCFFIGHREAPETLLPLLKEAVERHIVEYGVTDFVVGHYGRFDSLAAQAVKAAKQRHPEVTLFLLLPYHPYDRPIAIPKGCDGTFYPPGMEGTPRRAAIVKANRYMVDHSSHLIACVWHTASNARDILEYAQRREQRGHMAITLLPRP